MRASETIRQAVAHVAALRTEQRASAPLLNAVSEVKRLQFARFSGTYTDLLLSREYGDAARFFLEELYSDQDYSRRDAQFARIAGALEKVFPVSVVGTAVSLATLHGLTEELDHAMGQAWLGSSPAACSARRYVTAWQETARYPQRREQLDRVLQIGKELTRLTKMPGLRTMLRMMRRPAAAAGLGDLQNFLEAGFDTFANMAKTKGCVGEFLETIAQRESALLDRLSSEDIDHAVSAFEGTLPAHPKPAA